MIRFLAVLMAALLIGCATPDYNYQSKTTRISAPPVGSVNVAYIGEELLKQGKYTEHDAIYLSKKVDIGFAYDLLPGYYLKMGDDASTETYMPDRGNEGGDVKKSAFADPWKAVMAYKNKNKICVVTVINAISCNSNANFEKRKKPILANDSFQRTLIYNGKVGNKVNVGYREFSNHIARPAFNNQVEYDLNTSSTIGYMGARIEILEATNELIKYRVINNFNSARL